MNPDAYVTVRNLLDELYENYLYDLFEPLTYGKSWILVQGRLFRGIRIVAPLEYILSPYKSIQELNPEWGDTLSPMQQGIMRQNRILTSSWNILQLPTEEISPLYNLFGKGVFFGISTNQFNLVPQFSGHGKGLLRFFDRLERNLNNMLIDCDFEEANSEKYQYKYIVHVNKSIFIDSEEKNLYNTFLKDNRPSDI